MDLSQNPRMISFEKTLIELVEGRIGDFLLCFGCKIGGNVTFHEKNEFFSLKTKSELLKKKLKNAINVHFRKELQI